MLSRALLMATALLLVSGRETIHADPVVIGAATNAPSDLAKARQRLRVAPGLQVDLWAGEPLVQNITSVSFDDLGRAYVVETGRRRTSVFDIRNFKEWVPDDLALRTVEERTDYLRGMLATNTAFRAAATRSSKGGFGDFTGDGLVDIRDLEVESERIRLVWDADHDGKAESATVFAEGFNTSVSGVAAGVLASGTNVWFTCIPDLWRFDATPVTPRDGSRVAMTPPSSQARELLLHGFGVHIAYGGHDMHGLIKGPDGRLYFTIADRGATVTNREGMVISVPDAGSVFRCEPDGAKLEVFASGLRNPQELAFDEQGNLWTGDNNGDGGDLARWTLVLEGADYGWTIGWQWLPKMGAWNSERLWHTRESNTAAYLVPPVAHIGHGPAGIAYYPGTGLGDRFEGTLFMADFPGGVRTFRVEPDGAFFRVGQAASLSEPTDNSHADNLGRRAARPTWQQDNSSTNLTNKLLWDLYPVDVTFPPDGGVVVADWVEGWEKTGKGRLWHVTDPTLVNDPIIAETKRLLAEGMTQRKNDDLAHLLGHRDMRVRLNAQWELAGRGLKAWDSFAQIATGSSNRIARLHALWGLGQIVRTGKAVPSVQNRLLQNLLRLLPLLDDHDPEVRGHAARFMGQSHLAQSQFRLYKLMRDPNPRVAVQGVLACRDLYGAYTSGSGGLRVHQSLRQRLYELLPQMIRDRVPEPERKPGLAWFPELPEQIVRDRFDDPVVRHATVLMIARAAEMYGSLGPPTFVDLFSHTNADVRLTYLLAERRFAEPAIRQSLNDPDPRLVLEAARAIHDVPIPAAMPDLAALLQPDALERLLKQAEEMKSSSPRGAPLPFTADEWLTYTLRRAVNAAFRLGTETNALALAALSVRAEVPESVRLEAVEDLGLWPQPPRLDRVVGLHRPLPSRDPASARNALSAVWPQLSATSSTNLLVAALDAATALTWPRLPEALAHLANHPDATIREEAKRRAAGQTPVPFSELVARAEVGPMSQRQEAIRALAIDSDPQATEVLTRWATRLAAGDVPPGLALDVLEAVATRTPGLPALTAWTNSWNKDDRLAAYRINLEGGDALRGRRLFAERADWGCQRCHKLGGEGGDVGPDLTGIGRTRGRDEVLQSILYPNDHIAPGFENAILTRRDGSTVIGVVKAERPGELEIESPEDGRITVRTADILSRERGLSAMPEGLSELMTRRELRDLLEALAQ